MPSRIQSIAYYDMAQYDAVIDEIYQELSARSITNIADRIAWISGYFLGKPYLSGALGEGPQGDFDQNPLYRTDAFDCVTLINTVLAVALTQNSKDFLSCLLRLNYYEADPHYHKRFHFVSIDWNRENMKQGRVQEVTTKIQGATCHWAAAEIDRPNWVRYRDYSDIKLLHPISELEETALLEKLHALAITLTCEKSEFPYLPLTELFINGKPQRQLFRQIPHGSIIEIVRPNWNLRDKIGTNLNISHVGFALWVKNKLIFREASSLEKKVIDVPLESYLINYLTSATVKGIAILAVTEKT